MAIYNCIIEMWLHYAIQYKSGEMLPACKVKKTDIIINTQKDLEVNIMVLIDAICKDDNIKKMIRSDINRTSIFMPSEKYSHSFSQSYEWDDISWDHIIVLDLCIDTKRIMG